MIYFVPYTPGESYLYQQINIRERRKEIILIHRYRLYYQKSKAREHRIYIIHGQKFVDHDNKSETIVYNRNWYNYDRTRIQGRNERVSNIFLFIINKNDSSIIEAAVEVQPCQNETKVSIQRVLYKWWTALVLATFEEATVFLSSEAVITSFKKATVPFIFHTNF